MLLIQFKCLHLWEMYRGAKRIHSSSSKVCCCLRLLFIYETHNDPKNALSDPNTVLDIKFLKSYSWTSKKFYEAKLEILEKFGEDKVHLDE